MDDIVKQALAKWPNVPDCYGWLGLDARGNWYMRDDRAQAAGSFSNGTPLSKGSLLKHEKLIDFIHRNYQADERGQWSFQNGPQRVYVELEVAPLIWRINADFSRRQWAWVWFIPRMWPWRPTHWNLVFGRARTNEQMNCRPGLLLSKVHNRCSQVAKKRVSDFRFRVGPIQPLAPDSGIISLWPGFKAQASICRRALLADQIWHHLRWPYKPPHDRSPNPENRRRPELPWHPFL